jgi:hypothetical protein
MGQGIMGNTRTIQHAIGNGFILVSARARSIAEALALDAALQAVPVSEAFGPPTVNRAPPGFEDHPAFADSDDNAPAPKTADEA